MEGVIAKYGDMHAYPTSMRAAIRGDLESLKILHEAGIKFDDGIALCAQHGCHIETIEWLHEVGYTLDNPYKDRAASF